MAGKRGPTKAAREQMALLHAAGAVSPQTGKSGGDVPGLNPMTLGHLQRHKLVGSTVIRTAQRSYTVYWLTPLGVIAAQAEATSKKPKRKAAAKKAKADDIVGPQIITADQITKPGIYRMASPVYHGDPCQTPGLSSGIAGEIVNESARKGWRKSPRCPEANNTQRDPTYAMDIGSAVHAFAFGDAAADVVWIEADNFKDNRVKGWRATARNNGQVAILKRDKDRVLTMAELLVPVLERELGCKLEDAYGELVIACTDEETGGWRRTRADLMRADLRVILDLKSTEMSAHPDAVSKRLFEAGAHIQEALTHRILDRIDPAGAGLRVMKFVCVEQDAPHEISVTQIEPASNGIAAQQLMYAEQCWDHGIKTGEWPGYDKGVHRATMPSWMQMKWALKAIDLGIADINGETM